MSDLGPFNVTTFASGHQNLNIVTGIPATASAVPQITGAIRQAAKESVPYMRKLWDEREAQARKTVEAAGTQVVSDVDKKSFSDAMAPVYAKFASDPKLQDLVKRIQAAD